MATLLLMTQPVV